MRPPSTSSDPHTPSADLRPPRPGRRAALDRLATLGLAAVVLPTVATAQPPHRDAALIEAAARGDSAAVARWLSEGASVAARDARGRTALLAATEGNHVEAARQLMAAGADVNAQDSLRDSPFLLAGARGFTAIVRLALARNPDFAVTNRYGGTALIPACHYGHVETVQTLLGSRIPIDHVNNLGWTALLEAIILGDGGPAHTEIVRLLVAHGADVNLADRAGTTPLAHARKRGYREITSTLERAGAR